MAGRLGRFLLQGQMHALMPAVLLWIAGLDALDADPEAQPPDRELAQTEEGVAAGEGTAIVGADDRGSPKSLKARSNTVNAYVSLVVVQRVAAQQVAAREVGDGQRIAIALIGEHELTLVVGAPQIVRSGRHRQVRSLGLVAGRRA